MKKYRKKPVIVEAMQWDGTPEGATPIIDWVLQNGPDDGPVARYTCSDPERCAKNDGDCPHSIAIVTRDGVMYASPGDWVIREPFPTDDRLFYPCKPDIFDQTYEETE